MKNAYRDAGGDGAFVGKFFLVLIAILVALGYLSYFVYHGALAYVRSPTSDSSRVREIAGSIANFNVPHGYRLVSANAAFLHRWIEMDASDPHNPMRLRIERDSSHDSDRVDLDIRNRYVAALNREDCPGLRLVDISQHTLVDGPHNFWNYACSPDDTALSYERIVTGSALVDGETLTVVGIGNVATWDDAAFLSLIASIR